MILCFGGNSVLFQTGAGADYWYSNLRKNSDSPGDYPHVANATCRDQSRGNGLTLEWKKRSRIARRKLQAHNKSSAKKRQLETQNKRVGSGSVLPCPTTPRPLCGISWLCLSVREDYHQFWTSSRSYWRYNQAAEQMGATDDDLLSFAHLQVLVEETGTDFNPNWSAESWTDDLKPEQQQRQIDWILHPLSAYLGRPCTPPPGMDKLDLPCP